MRVFIFGLLRYPFLTIYIQSWSNEYHIALMALIVRGKIGMTYNGFSNPK